ncbi:MAG: hypothetical protein SGI91_05940 [Alphaproteobacteria bacterium]|nr:hypothetical protein [Alphaproteobacteria bacterium]
MTAGEIARRHFAAAMADCAAVGHDADAVARAMLSAAVASMLERRGVADVRSELLAAAENVDPDTDYAFMRP